MLNQKNKISGGLVRLFSSSETVRHFNTSPEVFVEDPTVVSTYFNLFSQAQLNELANHR